MKNSAALSRMQGYQSMHTPDFLLDKMPNFVEKVKGSFNKAYSEYNKTMIKTYPNRKIWSVIINLHLHLLNDNHLYIFDN